MRVQFVLLIPQPNITALDLWSFIENRLRTVHQSANNLVLCDTLGRLERSHRSYSLRDSYNLHVPESDVRAGTETQTCTLFERLEYAVRAMKSHVAWSSLTVLLGSFIVRLIALLFAVAVSPWVLPLPAYLPLLQASCPCPSL